MGMGAFVCVALQIHAETGRKDQIWWQHKDETGKRDRADPNLPISSTTLTGPTDNPKYHWQFQHTYVLWTEYLILTVVGELHSLTDWQVSDASEDAELDDFWKRNNER